MGPTKTRFAYAMVIVAVLYIYVPCTVASLTYRECGTRKFLQINTMSVKNKVVFGKAMVSIPCVKGVGSW
ncbi:hypothetical protein BIW11_02535 [Tropilaelaps mercedesae]|uniref:Uncharacterized protein n=1 Tax=Tropilaelaps mercedesae TaxID=418985 RepID=A0A1V9Y1I9_9ACAR|nr:hypothetical protein BIW11_02535 [Tropilaelaps mercedesae]